MIKNNNLYLKKMKDLIKKVYQIPLMRIIIPIEKVISLIKNQA
jgi:hypothetical protein